VCTFELILILFDPRVKTSLHGGYASQGLQVYAHAFIFYVKNISFLLMSEQQLLSHVKWSYCWTICSGLHREPSENLLGELQNVNKSADSWFAVL